MAKRGGTASGHADVIEEMRRITLALVVAVALAAPVAAQESVPAPERRGTIGAVILHFSSYENRHRLMRSCSITAASTDATSSAQGCLSSKRSGRRRATRAFMCTTTRQSIHGVALARRCASISQVQDASSLDYTSRTRTPSLGQIVVLRNTGGFTPPFRCSESRMTAVSTTETKSASGMRSNPMVRPASPSSSTCDGSPRDHRLVAVRLPLYINRTVPRFLVEAVLEPDSHPTRTPRRSAIVDSGRS